MKEIKKTIPKALKKGGKGKKGEKIKQGTKGKKGEKGKKGKNNKKGKKGKKGKNDKKGTKGKKEKNGKKGNIYIYIHTVELVVLNCQRRCSKFEVYIYFPRCAIK